MVKIEHVSMSPTMECNFSCSHCAFDSEPHKIEKIKMEVTKRYIDQMPGLKIENLSFTGGGEPFLYEHIDELIEYVNKMRKKEGYPRNISMNTNGYWINENVLPKLKELKKMGLDKIVISNDKYHLKLNEKNVKIAEQLINEKEIPEIELGGELALCPLGRAYKNLLEEEWVDPYPCEIHQYFDDDPPNHYLEPHITISIYPDGIYACCFKMWKIADENEKIIDAFKRIKENKILELIGKTSIADAIDNCRDYLPDYFSKKIGKVPYCMLCKEISESNELKKIIESKAEALIKEADEDFRKAIEEDEKETKEIKRGEITIENIIEKFRNQQAASSNL